MRTTAIASILALLLPLAGMVSNPGDASAQVDVTVDPATLNLGFMNVYNLPSDGGAFQFASPWGFADLVAYYDGPNLVFAPNTIGDPDPYWYIGGGGPGAPGNKIMEANGYAEQIGPLAGQTVTFSGYVMANTLTSSHTVVAFIRDFAPDFSSLVQTTVPLTGTGPFSISLDTINDPARPVQWGIQMLGVNVWVTDVEAFGSIIIAPEAPISSETSSFGGVKALFN
jgi:hypothetical protein